MTWYAHDAFWRKNHGRSTHYITTMVATFAGADDALQSHVMNIGRSVGLAINLPKDCSGLGIFDWNGAREVASLTTYPEMRIVSDFFIVSLVAIQAGSPVLSCVTEFRRPRVTGKTRQFGVCGRRIRVTINYRNNACGACTFRILSLTFFTVTFKAEDGDFLHAIGTLRLD